MNEKVLKTLEYDKIVALLADYASSPLGRAQCQALVPLTDIDEITQAQKETSDALTRVRLKGSHRGSGQGLRPPRGERRVPGRFPGRNVPLAGAADHPEQ